MEDAPLIPDRPRFAADTDALKSLVPVRLMPMLRAADIDMGDMPLIHRDWPLVVFGEVVPCKCSACKAKQEPKP